ncbi:unnamed protein product, partial [Mesorhabditis belari]|uniref:Uncharacterized protein n=1 Tax=Mesorhabditis belari TaxID=2138241 RepID=A0AAF3FBV3_9BILA
MNEESGHQEKSSPVLTTGCTTVTRTIATTCKILNIRVVRTGGSTTSRQPNWNAKNRARIPILRPYIRPEKTPLLQQENNDKLVVESQVYHAMMGNDQSCSVQSWAGGGVANLYARFVCKMPSKGFSTAIQMERMAKNKNF